MISRVGQEFHLSAKEKQSAEAVFKLVSRHLEHCHRIILEEAMSMRVTVPHQAPLFMGFSRQEYWSG